MHRDRTAVFGLAILVAIALAVTLNSARQLAGIYFASASGVAALAGLEKGLWLTPTNWRHARNLAAVSKAMGRREAALRYYAQAIDVFQGCGPCWIGVAETLSALGRDPTEALASAKRYGRSQTGVRTRAAVVFARLNDDESAAEEFSAALGGHRTDRGQFHALLHRLYTSDFILDRIITDDDLPAYFVFALSSLEPESARRVWQRYSEFPSSETQRAPYVNYLLRHGRVHQAWTVAFQEPVPIDGAMINSDFESYADAEPFGWRIDKATGVRARIAPCSDCASGRRALRLSFDGEHNVHYFGARQYLPVKPGASYELRARVRYDDITSARGPGIFVDGARDLSKDSGGACRLWAVGEEFVHSSTWTDTKIEFDVPEGCDGIRVLIGRPRTRRLDRFIGGDLWVDDLTLELVADTPRKSLEDIAGRVGRSPG